MTILRRATTTVRRYSTQSSAAIRGKPKWPLSKSKPDRRQRIPTPPISQPQTPISPNFNSSEFTCLRDLLTNQNLKPGPELENALNLARIDPTEALLLEIFNHLDSSPKPLFTLFRWVEKQPGFEFSVAVFNAMVNSLGKAREFDSAWSLILHHIKASKSPNLDTFAIMIRRYARAGEFAFGFLHTYPILVPFSVCIIELISSDNSILGKNSKGIVFLILFKFLTFGSA